MTMTKTIKVHDFTLNMLRKLKPEYVDQYPDKEITNDLIIAELIGEHEELNDPDALQEKEKKLHEEFVSRSKHSELYDEHIAIKQKQRELTDEYESNLKELNDKKNDLTRELKEQHSIYDNLQGTLSIKENELAQLNKKDKELRQSLITVKQDISNSQDKCTKLDKDYNRICSYVESECIEKTSLETLYHISIFLSKHKWSLYTLDQLCDALWRISNDDIKDSLTWTKYKIFPVRKVVMKDQEFYCFDRRYLKR